MSEDSGKVSWLARAVAALWGRRAARARTGVVSWIETADLASRFDRGREPIVVDVRGPDEFDGVLGHIRGARNLPLDQLPGRLPELAAYKDREITLVCRTQMRSAKAADLLREAGFGAVNVLRGGMEQWKQSGLPVEGPRP